MSCNKCQSQRCGCGDTPLNMPNTFSNDTSVCPPNSEECSEVFDMACICYQGDDIIEYDVKKGDRLDEVLQKILLALSNPACADFGDDLACQSPINLTISNLLTTGFDISWDPTPLATSYTVEYKHAASLIWLLNPVVTAPTVSDTIIGLSPELVYDIRVKATCPAGDCYSLNIRIQTPGVI